MQNPDTDTNQQSGRTTSASARPNSSKQMRRSTKQMFRRLICKLRPIERKGTSNVGYPDVNGLFLTPEVVASIGRLLSTEQEDTDFEARLLAKIDSVHVAAVDLVSQAREYDGHVDELTGQGPDYEEEAETIRGYAQMVRETQAIVQRRLEELQQHLEQHTARMQCNRTKLFAVLNNHFPQHQLMPHQQAGGSEVADSDDVVAPTNDMNGEDNGVRHNSASLREMQTPSVYTDHADRAEPFTEDPKLDALNDYKYYRLVLAQTEGDFENRHAAFEQERDELAIQLQAGELDDSMSQLDKRQILETRRLTKQLTKAEERYRAAKEAAIAAGVIFGSEAESGFVSRADDGYLLSAEIAEEVQVDRAQVEDWLAGLPILAARCGADTPNNSDSDQSDCVEQIQRCETVSELDSVQMCETRSAVGDGPYKRKIDQWRLKMEEVRKQLDGGLV